MNIPSIPHGLVLSDLKWKYLCRSVEKGRNILIVGPSGCGKTMCAQSVAAAYRDPKKFFVFNLGATQDPRGYLIGNTHFRPDCGTYVSTSLFVEAIQVPNAVILLDEISRGHFDAWNILMSVLDERQKYLRIDEHPDSPTIQVADGVCFIATANIGNEYTATRVLDRGLLDRFTNIIEMEPLSLADEMKLLNDLYCNIPGIEPIATIASFTRNEVQKDTSKLSVILSTRSTKEMASMLVDGFTLAEIAEVCIYPLYSPAGGVQSQRTFMKQLVQRYLTT